jgi:hypothetical protein
MSSERYLSDASHLSDIGVDNLRILYEYAMSVLNRLQKRFIALDSKASQTISLLAIVSGIFVSALPSSQIANGEIKVMLYGSIICFIIAILFCLLCLRVRVMLEPPTIEGAVRWIFPREKKQIDLELFSAIIVDLANAEKSQLKIYNLKAKYLNIGQLFEVIGVISLLASIGISNIKIV